MKNKEQLREIMSQAPAPPRMLPRISLGNFRRSLAILPNVAQELKVFRPFGMFNPLVIWSTEIKGYNLRYTNMQCYKPGDRAIWEVEFRNTGSIPLACILRYGDMVGEDLLALTPDKWAALGHEGRLAAAGKYGITYDSAKGWVDPHTGQGSYPFGSWEQELNFVKAAAGGYREEEVTLSGGVSVIKEVSFNVMIERQITLEASIKPKEKVFSLLFTGDSRQKTYNIGLLSYRDKPLNEYPMSGALNFDYTPYGMNYDSIVSMYADYKPENAWSKSTWKVEFGGVTREEDVYGYPINNILYRQPSAFLSIYVQVEVETTRAMAYHPKLQVFTFYEDGYHTSGFAWVGAEVPIAAGERKTIVFDRIDLPAELYGKLLIMPYLLSTGIAYLGPGKYDYLGGELLAP